MFLKNESACHRIKHHGKLGNRREGYGRRRLCQCPTVRRCLSATSIALNAHEDGPACSCNFACMTVMPPPRLQRRATNPILCIACIPACSSCIRPCHCHSLRSFMPMCPVPSLHACPTNMSCSIKTCGCSVAYSCLIYLLEILGWLC
jgi:hypothetical protein